MNSTDGSVRTAVALLLVVSCVSQLQAQTVSPRARVGFLRETAVEVTVIDGRQKREEFGKVPAAIADALMKAYPDAKVSQTGEAQFYELAKTGMVSIKIQVVGYGKGFGIEAGAGLGLLGGSVVPIFLPQGKWNGVSVLLVTVFDKRDGHEDKQSTTISKVVSKANTWGTRSGNQAMSESLAEAINGLLNYIDSLFLA